jgi:hypothetical protein
MLAMSTIFRVPLGTFFLQRLCAPVERIRQTGRQAEPAIAGRNLPFPRFHWTAGNTRRLFLLAGELGR